MRIRIRPALVSLGLTAVALPVMAQSTDLEAVSLTAPSGSFYAGSTVLVGYEVRNNGPNAAFGYTVVMHASSDPVIEASDPQTSTFENGPLAAGTSCTGLALVTLPFDLPAGTHYLGMRIVYAFDSTSGNNAAHDPDPIAVLAPSDLWVSWIGTEVYSIYQGQTRRGSCAVRNLGPGDCPGYPVSFYASHDRFLGESDRKLLTVDKGGIAVGAGETFDVEIPIPADLAPGRYYVGAVVDYPYDPWESNNRKFADSDFEVMGAPDLEIEGVSVPAGEYHPGDPAGVTLTVRNAGLGASIRHTAVFYASADASIGPGDLELAGVEREVRIEPGATDTFVQGITLPPSPGSWYIGVVATDTVDPFPSNNTGRTPLTIVHHPLRVTRCARHGPAILHVGWTSHAYDGNYRIHAASSPDGPFAPILSPFPATPPENEAYVGMGAGSRLFLRIAAEP